jgi:hypothetical protein
VAPPGETITTAEAEIACWDDERGAYTWVADTHPRVTGTTLSFVPQRFPCWLVVWNLRDAWGEPLGAGPAVGGPFHSAEVLRAASLRFPPPRQVRGRVLDEGSLPVPGLVVKATLEEGRDRVPIVGSAREATARTDACGDFRFDGLWNGTYRLEPAVPEAWGRAPSVEIGERGDVAGLELRVHRPAPSASR